MVRTNSNSVEIQAEKDYFDGSQDSNILELTGTSTTIHKVVTPTENGDAANKKYVDDSIAGITIPIVPTNVSSFTNDSGYLTLATLPIYDGTVV